MNSKTTDGTAESEWGYYCLHVRSKVRNFYAQLTLQMESRWRVTLVRQKAFITPTQHTSSSSEQQDERDWEGAILNEFPLQGEAAPAAPYCKPLKFRRLNQKEDHVDEGSTLVVHHLSPAQELHKLHRLGYTPRIFPWLGPFILAPFYLPED